MGVIKKTLFRGNILGKPRHRNLFLDMEENIHIHYRDLRIELSRGEFEDIASAFAKQASELQAIIEEKKYQDGKLPNANQDDVRIWTESRLKHEVKYHPQRFSLEECGDGYHFHYRNYKLLIDQDEFRQIARLFASLDIDGPYASSYEEVLALLEANDVDFTLDAGNIPGEVLAIAVAQHHVPKIRDIFNYIGFATEDAAPGEKRYRGERLRVLARPENRRGALEYRRLRGQNAVGRLVDYLAAQGAGIDADEVNVVKCQVLDFYGAARAGKANNVDTDPQAWLYSPPNRQVVFPYKAGAVSGSAEAESTYRAWSGILNGLQLGFVKPTKEIIAADIQATLRQQVEETLRREVAACAAVDKVYLMGSALRGDMGRYRAPFIHGKLAKLGSDIDILVEIDPAREDDIPANWHCHLPQASNHCAVYHIAEIPLGGGDSDWPPRHPNVEFIPHLVDAYVSLPSQGFRAEKDAFLKKFGAKLFYDRARDGILYRGEEEERIAARIAELHGYPWVAVERMKVSTENAIFKVFADGGDYILKLFKVSGNYHRGRVAEHTAYEEKLIAALKGRGIPTAGVIPARQAADTTVEGFPALLFERIPGTVQQRPEYPLAEVGAALAAIHRVQMENPLELETEFSFDDTCLIWLPAFENQIKQPNLDGEIVQAFAALAPLAERCFPGENRAVWFARSPMVHNHGDVTPKNFIVGTAGEARFFDFNNAFFGPRMADLIDGAFEFSLAEKYIHLADFGRFDALIEHYAAAAPLTPAETEDLPAWIALMGVIKFAKEVRVLLERPKENLRRKRALAIADFIVKRVGKT
ncbi:MAG: phosphotransferase [Sulfurisoma sp.]|nr:phosphotransferase [Sulfurisoma sp.]